MKHACLHLLEPGLSSQLHADVVSWFFLLLQASTIVFLGSHLSIPGKQTNQETGEVRPPLSFTTRCWIVPVMYFRGNQILHAEFLM